MRGWKWRTTVVLALFLIWGGFGASCGKKTFKVSIALTPQLPQPIYVAVYYLTQDGALNGIKNTDLVGQVNENRELPGVLDAKVQPVYPNLPAVQVIRAYDAAVTTLVIVANLPGDCARQKVQGQEAKKMLQITIDENKCLRIQQ